ncbi:MAG: hypothetical protein AABW59_00470 [archaeon]
MGPFDLKSIIGTDKFTVLEVGASIGIDSQKFLAHNYLVGA